MGQHFDGGHETVSHKRRDFVRKDGATSNTAESVFALGKRGMCGTFHSVSRHHLHLYLSEFAFRWNIRAMDDDSRVVAAANAGEGSRFASSLATTRHARHRARDKQD